MSAKADVENAGKCPVMHKAVAARSNHDWWPNQLDLRVLHRHSSPSDPI